MLSQDFKQALINPHKLTSAITNSINHWTISVPIHQHVLLLHQFPQFLKPVSRNAESWVSTKKVTWLNCLNR